MTEVQLLLCRVVSFTTQLEALNPRPSWLADDGPYSLAAALGPPKLAAGCWLIELDAPPNEAPAPFPALDELALPSCKPELEDVGPPKLAAGLAPCCDPGPPKEAPPPKPNGGGPDGYWAAADEPVPQSTLAAKIPLAFAAGCALVGLLVGLLPLAAAAWPPKWYW